MDEVREKKRNEERKAKQEIEEGLKAFRERQKGETSTVDAEEAGEGEDWGVGRKRKRVKERLVKGVRRKASESDDKGIDEAEEKSTDQAKEVKETKTKQTKQPVPAPVEKKSLGLVAYGSDSDDDDD